MFFLLEFDVVPDTDHSTMAADPSTTAALEIVGTLVSAKVSTPTMTGTFQLLTAVGTAARPTEEATTEVVVKKVSVLEWWL